MTRRIKVSRKKGKHEAGRAYGRKNRKKGSGAIAAVIIVVVIAVAALCALGAYAKGLDTVYPNVSVNGVKVGGMTAHEAAEELGGLDVVNTGDESVSLSFPGGTELEISRSQAGLAVTANDVAEMAYSHGRGGNVFTNAFAYIKCFLYGEELNTEDIARNIDEEGVRALIAEAAKKVNSSVIESAYSISGDRLVITKGLSNVQVSEDGI